MKRATLKITLLNLLIFNCASSPTFAIATGDLKGNGGDAVVCRDDKNNIVSVRLWDLFEAERLRGYTFKSAQNIHGSDSDLFKFIGNSLEAWTSADKYEVFKTAASFQENVRFVTGVQLVDIPDSDSVVLPVGCQLEQLAIQKPTEFPGDKFFTVNRDLWDKMYGLDRIALIMHESFYKLAIEKHFATESRATRFFNSWAWSDTAAERDLPKLIQAIQAGNFLGSIASNPSARSLEIQWEQNQYIWKAKLQIPATGKTISEDGAIDILTASIDVGKSQLRLDKTSANQLQIAAKGLVSIHADFFYLGDLKIYLNGPLEIDRLDPYPSSQMTYVSRFQRRLPTLEYPQPETSLINLNLFGFKLTPLDSAFQKQRLELQVNDFSSTAKAELSVDGAPTCYLSRPHTPWPTTPLGSTPREIIAQNGFFNLNTDPRLGPSWVLLAFTSDFIDQRCLPE